jgi:hypothetical protein
MSAQPGLHRWGDAQRLVNANEITVHEMKRDSVGVIAENGEKHHYGKPTNCEINPAQTGSFGLGLP